MKLLDIHGIEIMNTGSIDIQEIKVGKGLGAGLYILYITIGSFIKNIVKTE